MRHAVFFLLLLTLGACQTLSGLTSAACPQVPIDLSVSATDAGDKTLVHSACHAAPSGGLDICRVVDGSVITEEWQLILPHDPKAGTEGTIRIRYRDNLMSIPITGPVVKIPWKEIVRSERWNPSLEGPAQAVATIKVETPHGPQWVDMLGIAIPIVLSRGYEPLPMDSGAEKFATDCKVQYTTAGRSAITCGK